MPILQGGRRIRFQPGFINTVRFRENGVFQDRLIRGTKLSRHEFYDPDEDILITAHLSEVGESTLSLLEEDHRNKLIPFVSDEKVVLARRYATDGSSKLRIVTRVPKDDKFDPKNVTEALKGKSAGTAVREVITQGYSEIADAGTIATLTTQKSAKELIAQYVEAMSNDDKKEADIPLPTGIDNSLKSIFPIPIYIPAVKDPSDELKTTESASFGKLLNILLDVIEEDLVGAKETFASLRKNLNRITGEDGSVSDERLQKVRDIETTIQGNLQETFRDVSIELEIPPPEIKTILSNANIVANDGMQGPINHKGDGFKRAIAFSILRSYVQLSQRADWHREDVDKPLRSAFLFLFEEPELYLHPRAQNVLYDALSIISQRHQVLVTTHSPLFFSAKQTTTFIKIAKRKSNDFDKPEGVCSHIQLTNMVEKDKFQLVSFETSNLAFFSERIVLVEGDSEVIAIPHICKLLDPTWCFKTTSTSLVQIKGKGSFLRYKKFFERFKTEVFMVSDLDILIRDFDKLEPSERAGELRNELLQEVDQIIEEENKQTTPKPRLLKEQLQKDRARVIYEQIQNSRQEGDSEKLAAALDELFVFEKTEPRLEVLQDHTYEHIRDKKRLLLSELRKGGVFVLEKGAIEAYYPEGITGGDKPSKAQSFCSMVKTDAAVLALCEEIDHEGQVMHELKVVASSLFRSFTEV